MAGGVVSWTVMRCDAVAVLLASSTAVQFTIVVPSGNREGASLATEATPTASDATGESMSTGVPSGEEASAVASGGAASDGGVVSATSTACSAAAEFPASSVAVQVMTVRPIGSVAGASPVTAAGPAASEAAGGASPWPDAAAS